MSPFPRFLIMGAITVVAALGALAIARRARFESRVELFVSAGVIWNAMIVIPIFVLGLTNTLTRFTVPVVVTAISIAALSITGYGRSSREHVADLSATLLSLLRLPRDAFIRAWRERSLTLVGSCKVVCV